MQHVGIGENDVAVLADGLPRIRRGVAVVGENTECIAHPAPQVLQFG